jgi:hypothetical protein
MVSATLYVVRRRGRRLQGVNALPWSGKPRHFCRCSSAAEYARHVQGGAHDPSAAVPSVTSVARDDVPPVGEPRPGVRPLDGPAAVAAAAAPTHRRRSSSCVLDTSVVSNQTGGTKGDLRAATTPGGRGADTMWRGRQHHRIGRWYRSPRPHRTPWRTQRVPDLIPRSGTRDPLLGGVGSHSCRTRCCEN